MSKKPIYELDGIKKIIELNDLKCDKCYKGTFNIDYYKISYSPGSVSPILHLICDDCGHENELYLFNIKRPIPDGEIKADDIMCYTGKCNYERGGGDYVGECTLNCKPGEYPDDAYCVEQDLLIDEEELLNNYYKQINQYNQNKQEEINDDTFDFDDFDLDEEEI